MTVTSDTLLCLFRSKIEDAVSLVPGMGAEEKLKAVQFWNAVSGKLQEIINNSAADIDAIAMTLNENNKKIALQMECSQNNSIPPQNGYYTSEFMNGAANLIVCNDSNAQFMPENLSNTQHRPYLQSNQENSFQLNSYSNENVALNSALDCNEHSPKHGLNLVTNGYNKLCSLPTEDETAGVLQNDNLQDDPNISQKSKCKRPNNSVQSTTKTQHNETTNVLSETSMDSSKDSEPQTEDLSKDSALLELCSNVEHLNNLQPEAKANNAPDLSSNIDQAENLICEWCAQEFTNAFSLRTHQWIHTKPYSCPECHAQFSSKGNLRVHQRKHTGEKPYLCSTCTARFSTKGNLKRHCKTHSGEKPFQCSQCQSRFTEKKSLKVHMRRHTGEKPYECSMCGMKFTQSGILQSHMAMHMDEKAHLCEHCGKAFRQKSQLRIHMMRHKGVKNYYCNSCPSRFLTKGDLDRHTRTHTGERPFACDQCKKSFTRQQSLNEHMNRHYGIKPYECKECGKSFYEMSACYKHIKLHNTTQQKEGKQTLKEKICTQMIDNTSLMQNSTNSISNTNALQSSEKFTVILRNNGEEIQVCSRFVLDQNSGNINSVLTDSENFPRDLSSINLLAVEAATTV